MPIPTAWVLITLEFGTLLYVVWLPLMPAVYRKPLQRGDLSTEDAERRYKRLTIGLIVYGGALLFGATPQLGDSGTLGAAAWCGIVLGVIAVIVGVVVRRSVHRRITAVTSSR